MAASSGALDDFARLPLSRKILIFVVIGALGGALYYQFAYKSLVEKVQAAEADNRGKAAQNKKLAEDIPKFEELKSRMKELTAIITENQKALPTEAEVPAFFETLERKIQESGVEINKWTKLPEGPVETFVRVPVAIEMTGTFMQIKRFFASLIQRGLTNDNGVEERERVISIEGLSLVNPTVRNRELVLTAKFVAVTFRQEDKAEAPAAAPAAAPAPGGRSTAPLPGASTPAGAKARVDSAIDKGDKVDRNAAGVEEAKTPAAGDGSAKLKGGM